MKVEYKNMIHFFSEREDAPEQVQIILTKTCTSISDKTLVRNLNDVSMYIKILEEKNNTKKLIIGALVLLCVFQASKPLIDETRSCVGPFFECFSDSLSDFMSGNIVEPLINPQN